MQKKNFNSCVISLEYLLLMNPLKIPNNYEVIHLALFGRARPWGGSCRLRHCLWHPHPIQVSAHEPAILTLLTSSKAPAKDVQDGTSAWVSATLLGYPDEFPATSLVQPFGVQISKGISNLLYFCLPLCLSNAYINPFLNKNIAKD